MNDTQGQETERQHAGETGRQYERETEREREKKQKHWGRQQQRHTEQQPTGRKRDAGGRRQRQQQGDEAAIETHKEAADRDIERQRERARERQLNQETETAKTKRDRNSLDWKGDNVAAGREEKISRAIPKASKTIKAKDVTTKAGISLLIAFVCLFAFTAQPLANQPSS